MKSTKIGNLRITYFTEDNLIKKINKKRKHLKRKFNKSPFPKNLKLSTRIPNIKADMRGNRNSSVNVKTTHKIQNANQSLRNSGESINY